MSPTTDIAEIPVTPTEAKAYGALDRFRPGTNFAAWLYRIMVNSYINGYRKQRRRPQATSGRRTGLRRMRAGPRHSRVMHLLRHLIITVLLAITMLVACWLFLFNGGY
jgi:Sigma-70 region 2